MGLIASYRATNYPSGFDLTPNSTSGDFLFGEWGPKTGTGVSYPPMSTEVYKQRNLVFAIKNTGSATLFFGAATSAERNSVYSNAAVSVSKKNDLGLFLTQESGFDYLSFLVCAVGQNCWNGTPGNSNLMDNKTGGTWGDACKDAASGWSSAANVMTYDLTTLNVVTLNTGKHMAAGNYSNDSSAEHKFDIPWGIMMQVGWNWNCTAGYPYQWKVSKWCWTVTY